MEATDLAAVDNEIEEEISKSVVNGYRNLYLNYKGLNNLPPSVYTRCQHIQKLYLKRNTLVCLPPQICHLSNLTELYLHSNCLTRLPDEIGLITTLVSLDVSNNQLTALPNTCGLLSNLQRLQASSNALRTVPKQLGYLKQLRTLQVADNSIQRLPEELGECRSLRCLMVDSNALHYLPHSLHRCRDLEEIYLNGNKLLFIPPNLAALTRCQLRAVYVDSNPFLQAQPVALRQHIRGFGNGVVRGEMPVLGSLLQVVTSHGDIINIPPQIQQVRCGGGPTLTLLELALRCVDRYRDVVAVQSLPKQLYDVLRSPTAWCNVCPQQTAIYTDAYLAVGLANPHPAAPPHEQILTTNLCCSHACLRRFTELNQTSDVRFQPVKWKIYGKQN